MARTSSHRGLTIQRFNDSILRRIFPVLSLFLVLLLTSCIEYREELWLEHDLSGKISFDIGLPLMSNIEDDEISELSIVALCDSVEGIEVKSHNSYLIDENTWIHVDLSFDNVILLNEIENKWFGEFYILDDDESRTIKRFISMSDTISTGTGQMERVLKYAMLGQYSWIYTMHFPDELYEVNAHLARTDTTNNTAVWEFNLASLVNEQKTIMGRYRQRSGFNRFFQTIFK